MKKEKLSDFITVKVNGEPRQVFMSFNKLNQCQFVAGDVEDIMKIMITPSLRMSIMKVMLGEKEVLADLDEQKIDLDDSLLLVEFVTQHLLDFTMGAAERMQKMAEKAAPRIQALQRNM